MSYRLEIWIIAQKWMTMNKNVKKEGKKQKGGEIITKMFRPITISPAFVPVYTLLLATYAPAQM